MKKVSLPVLVALLACGSSMPVHAYLKFGVRVGADVIDVKWNRPIQYFITDRNGPGVTAVQLQDTVGRAFSTWQAVSTARIQSQFQALSIVPPGLQDGRTTIGFLDRPELDRVLGATTFLLDAASGEIIEADIFFNTRFDWSTASGGEAGRVDLESVALHEIGHLLGLGHSALGETEMIPGGRRVIGSGAVMFPIAMSPGVVADRVLQADDLAGISDLYPTNGFDREAASITGRVIKNGTGVLGAHVVAFNLETGALIGGFVLNASGAFVIAGLPPGTYAVRAEPLDDAEPESFFPSPVDVDFRVAYAQRVVAAPRGGSTDAIEIQVRPK